MTVRLPDELRTVVVAHPGVPLELVDDQTHASYVLLPTEQFERLAMAADGILSDTYPAQVESCLRGRVVGTILGWTSTATIIGRLPPELMGKIDRCLNLWLS